MNHIPCLFLLLTTVALLLSCAPAPTPAPTAAPPTAVPKPTQAPKSLSPVNTPQTNKAGNIPVAPELNSLAPDFTLKDPNGKNYNLWSLRGSPVLLNFWATWCGPCLSEMPALQSLFRRYKDQQLIILAVDGDGESASDIVSYRTRNGLEFPLLVDTEEKTPKAYGIRAFPTSIFIDRNGVIKYINAGSLDESGFDKILNSTILVRNPSPTGQNEIQGTMRIQLLGEFWSSDISEPHYYRFFSVSEKDFSNFTIQSDVEIKSNTHEYYGLLFRQHDNKNFYSFRITPDGFFEFDVWYSDANSFDTLLGPTKSVYISQGTGRKNTLRVKAQGQNFNFYINGQYVGSASDTRFRSGKVGVILCTCDGSSSASAAFSSFSLYDQP